LDAVLPKHSAKHAAKANYQQHKRPEIQKFTHKLYEQRDGPGKCEYELLLAIAAAETRG
jgi:hypothetical protein